MCFYLLEVNKHLLKWFVLIVAAYRLCSWIIMACLLFGIESIVVKSQCYLLQNKHCPPVLWNLVIFFVPISQRLKMPFCIKAPLTKGFTPLRLHDIEEKL